MNETIYTRSVVAFMNETAGGALQTDKGLSSHFIPTQIYIPIHIKYIYTYTDVCVYISLRVAHLSLDALVFHHRHHHHTTVCFL